METNYAISIGRQLGSGGREIGEKLAARLNIQFLDKKLIEMASEQSGLCTEFFEKADEKTSQGIIGGLFGMRFPFVTDGVASSMNCLSNDALFKIQSDVIRQVADASSCLFVGRCSDYILRDHPRVLNLFITANHQDRISRLQTRHTINEEQAQTMIEKIDKKRADYYNYYTYKSWGSANSYHLCINSSVLGIDKTVDMLELFVRQTFAL